MSKIPRLGTWTNTSQACQRVITGNSEPQTQRNFLNSWIQNYLLVTSRWTVIARYYCGFLKSVKGYQNYSVFTIYNDPYGNLEMLSDDEDDGAFLIYESKSSGLE